MRILSNYDRNATVNRLPLLMLTETDSRRELLSLVTTAFRQNRVNTAAVLSWKSLQNSNPEMGSVVVQDDDSANLDWSVREI